jgi:hypothetical protein
VAKGVGPEFKPQYGKKKKKKKEEEKFIYICLETRLRGATPNRERRRLCLTVHR